MRKSGFLIILSVLFNYSFSNGQGIPDSIAVKPISISTMEIDSIESGECKIKDVPDVFRDLFKKEISLEKSAQIKKINLLILPSLTSSPANGFMLGVNATGTWAFGDPASTRLSMANAKVVITTENQLITYLKTSIYTKDNNYFLNGDFRFYLYSLPTYGLGTNAPDTIVNDPDISWDGFNAAGKGSFPMSYDYIVFHQSVNKKVSENVYVGMGYQLDAYRNINDEILDLDTFPLQITPHWAYSKYYDIDSSNYASSGLSANFVYDSRDNLLNPYSGYYFNVHFRYNTKLLGSTKESSMVYLEFRTYVGLSERTPRHLLAFWFFGNFQTSGHSPYYTLMALGDDQKATSGRGYIAGRYRGEQLVYGEVEYRFPILRCSQTLGGVIFVNAVSTTNLRRGVYLFDYVKPAVGVGLRVLMNKSVRLNIAIDYAIGFRSQGFYFNSGDAF